MPFITPNPTQHKYVVGIDFGHGETSAAYCEIKWSEEYTESPSLDDLDIFPGKIVIPSLLLERENIKLNITDKYIGELAINRLRKNDGIKNHFYGYFKDRPSKLSIEKKRIVKTFMHETYKQILETNRDILKDDNHIVFIACPSSMREWSDDEMNSYAEIASDAGIPLASYEGMNLGIIRESRAAFIKCKKTQNAKVNDGFLLIDFGSSTVDLTYYNQSLEKPIDKGYEIGASKVEEALKTNLENTYTILGDILIDESENIRFTYYLRKHKEEFYTNNCDGLYLDIDIYKLSNAQYEEDDIEVSYSESEFHSFREMKNYMNSVEEKLIEFRNEYLAEKRLLTVFVTGGASRMDWVKNKVSKIFEGAEVIWDKGIGASTAISQGIALVGRADVRTIELEKRLINIIPNYSDIYFDVIADMSNSVSKSIITDFETEIKRFKDSNTALSVADLEERLKNRLKKSYGYFANQSYSHVGKNKIEKNLLPQMNKIIKEYSSPCTIIKFQAEQNFSISEISLDDSFASTINTLVNSIADGFVLIVGKVLLSIVGAYIQVAANVVENIGTGLHNIWVTINDEKWKKKKYKDVTDVEVMEVKDKYTKLFSDDRKKVYDKFIDEKEELQGQISGDILVKLYNNSDLKETINSNFAKDLEQFIRASINSVRYMLS